MQLACDYEFADLVKIPWNLVVHIGLPPRVRHEPLVSNRLLTDTLHGGTSHTDATKRDLSPLLSNTSPIPLWVLHHYDEKNCMMPLPIAFVSMALTCYYYDGLHNGLLPSPSESREIKALCEEWPRSKNVQNGGCTIFSAKHMRAWFLDHPCYNPSYFNSILFYPMHYRCWVEYSSSCNRGIRRMTSVSEISMKQCFMTRLGYIYLPTHLKSY